jgi:hypothetical protein
MESQTSLEKSEEYSSLEAWAPTSLEKSEEYSSLKAAEPVEDSVDISNQFSLEMTNPV